MERETDILQLAQQKLATAGYLGLNMDVIASELEYSKGTIYNHFACKEEIILALAVQTLQRRTDLFRRGARFEGPPRHRLAAIGVAAELFVRLYPNHFHVEQLIRSYSIWEKTSEQRREVMRSCEVRCMEIVAGVVRDALAVGDLQLPDPTTPEDLVFGLWSQTFGAYSIIATSDSLLQLGIAEPYEAVRQAIKMTLDGYGWRPLSSDFDYAALLEKIQTEVFADECREAFAS